MSRNILCAIYLLIAISAVHSASYYYRAGREVIVPTIEEVKEVISELKKDEGVIVEEIVASVPSEPVEPVVKSVTLVENVGPVIEAIETNVVADAEKIVLADAEKVVVADEARSKPTQVLRLETLEVIQPSGEKSEKVVTVAETVKNAAIQAVESQNQEVAESVKAVVAPIVEPIVPLAVDQVVAAPVVAAPVVENVDASVKSVEPVVPVVAPVVPVVAPVVESVVPAVEVEQVVKETLRSADPEPAKPEEPIKSEEPAKEEKNAEVQQPTEKSVVASPEIRQTPGPLDQISNAITTFTNTLQTAVQTVFQGGQNAIQSLRPPSQQSDTEAAETPASELNTAEHAPVADATQAAAPTTASPNLLQSVQQAITQFTNNIIPAQLRPTTAPAVAHPETPVVVSGTRGGEDATVEVVHNIDVDINDKVDELAKKTQ